MSKFLKFIAYILLGLVALLLTLVVVLKLIPDSQYKDWITGATQDATGRDFSIENLDLDFGTSFRVRADQIRMANADWGQADNMLQVGHLEADIGLLALLGGKLDVRAVLENTEMSSETNAEGVSNWALGDGSEELTEEQAIEQAEPFSGLPLQPFVREIRLDNFKLSLIQAADSPAKVLLVKQLLIETPQLDTTLLLDADIEGNPLKLSGNIGNMAQFLVDNSEPLRLNGTLNDSSIDVSGNWGPLLPQQNMALDLKAEVPSTAALAALAGLGEQEFGAITLSGKMMAQQSLYAIKPLEIDLKGPNLDVAIKGSVDNLMEMQGIELTTDANSETLQQLLKQIGLELPVPVPPGIKINARIDGNLEELALSDVVVAIRDEGVDINATASIGDLLNLGQINGKLSGTVESLSLLSKYAGVDLPSFGKVDISADIASAEKSLKLDNLSATLASQDINFRLTGEVGDLLTVTGIDAQAELGVSTFSEQTIAELRRVLAQFDTELPAQYLPQSINLSTGIQGNLEKLALLNIKGEVLDKGIVIGLNGTVENVIKTEGIAAQLSLDSDNINNFSKYAGTDLPDLGPLKASASLESQGKTYRVSELKLNLDDDSLKADLLASIADVLAITGVEAELNARVASLDSLSELAQTELPATDPVIANITLSEDKAKKPTFVIHAETGDANVDINGSLASLAVPDELAIALSVTAANLTDFDKIAQSEFPDHGPLDLSANLQLAKSDFAVSDLKLNLADQSATGDLSLSLPETDTDLTVVKGKLDIPYLNLDFLAPKADPEAEAQASTEDTPAEAPIPEPENADIVTDTPPQEKLFSSDPIILDRLNDFDIDIAVTAAKIKFDKADFRDVKLSATVKDGLLDISPIEAQGGVDGTINGYIRIDGREAIPALDMDITIEKFPMISFGGAMDLNLDVTGQGASIAALMGSLNGQMLLVARDGKIEKGLATNFGSGLLTFSDGEDYTDLECAILRVDIKDGIADFDNKLAAQLTAVTWRGGGEINLKTEELQVGISPKQRKGIPLSAGTLASLMYVSGTLKNPKMQLDPTDVAVKYAKYSAYLATGGLSLVAEMIKNKIQANQDVCEKILAGTVFSDEGEAEEQPVTDQAGTAPGETTNKKPAKKVAEPNY